MRIEVTKKHIRIGYRGSPSLCPVARALQDATGESWMVNGCAFRRDAAGERHEVPLSYGVLRTIDRYDGTGKMDPFEFEFTEGNQ